MRLYKMEITEHPKTYAVERSEYLGDGYDTEYVTHHLANETLRKEWEESGLSNEASSFHFFVPSEDKFYRSRSSARDKVKIVERWGGKARILEAQVSEFIPIEEANKRRKIARLESELAELYRSEQVPF